MNVDKALKAIFNEVMKEVKQNQDFRQRVTAILEKHCPTSQKAKKRPRRRKPGPFDPIEVYQLQPDLLEVRLEDLEIDQLKDIIAEHGMDRSRLAMRWKTKKRLVDLIIDSVRNRVQKGEEFRKTESDVSSSDSIEKHEEQS